MKIPYIKTNCGLIPLDDYQEIKASELGFDSYSEMLQEGFYVDLFSSDIIYVEENELC